MGLYAELKRAKKKRGGFGVKRLRDKWRYQTYDVQTSYHELTEEEQRRRNEIRRGSRR